MSETEELNRRPKNGSESTTLGGKSIAELLGKEEDQ